MGLDTHEEADAELLATSLGRDIDGERGMVFTNPVKLWKIRLAFQWLSRRPVVSGCQLERLIGHATHVMLLNRPLLSIFRSLYDFIRSHYAHTTRLWASAARESGLLLC